MSKFYSVPANTSLIWGVVLAGCLGAFPTKTYGQGISLAGIGEGSLLVLPANGSATNLAVTATPNSPAGSTNITFVLERQGTVMLTRTSPPPYAVTFSNLTAGKYFLSASLVGPGTLPTGNVSFDITAVSLAPVNDNWNQPSALAGLNVISPGTNTYATTEPNEPVHAGIGAGKSIWWTWTALSNGVFTATTAGSSFDTVLGVYTGTNVGTLTQIQAGDDAGAYQFSQVTFFATNGMIYYFVVDSAYPMNSGKAQLKLVAGAPSVISIASPTDGLLMLVPSPTTVTNVTVSASITDPAGVATVNYSLDGGSGAGRNGILPPPYQLNLTNLTEGNYLLTMAASNNASLISVTNVGFSVISLAPFLVTEKFPLSSNRFRFAVTGFKGRNYAIQASKKLDVWCAVKTFTNFAGAEKVTDTNAAQFSQRFYRASSSQ